jgi:hypothetical protein
MIHEVLSILFWVVLCRLTIISFKKEKPTNEEEVNSFFVHLILTTVIYLIIKWLFY